MKISSPNTPGRSDIPNVPEDTQYLEAYFDPRDKTVADIVDALQGLLSPRDNMNYEAREILLYHGQATSVLLERIKGGPVKAELEWTQLDDFAKFKWRPLGQDKISVTINFDTAPSAPQLVRIGVWGP